MIQLTWLAKVYKTLNILGITFILLGWGIGIVSAGGVFSFPDWVWTISNIGIRFFAIYLGIRTFGTSICCRIKPSTFSGVCLSATSGLCMLAGCLAISSFVCSFITYTVFSIVGFISLSVGLFVFLLTENSLSQRATKRRLQTTPADQYEDYKDTETHSTPSWDKTAPSLSQVSPTQKVFICYDVEDAALTKQLCGHLHHLVRLGLIDLWDQTKILPGAMSQDEIEHAIESAGVAIILISANLLNSDYIMEYQLPTLLDHAETRGTWVIPIKARDCSYKGTGLELFQPFVLPDKRPKTLEEMSVAERNELFSHLAERIPLQLGVEIETRKIAQTIEH